MVEKRSRSVSQIKLMRQCPERYYWARIKREPFVPSAAIIQGTAFHETYAEWELSGRKIDVGAAYLSIYKRELDKYAEEIPITKWTVWGRGRSVVEDIEIRRELGKQQALTYSERCKSEKDEWRVYRLPDGDLAVEVAFSIDIGTTNVVGSIDVIREITPADVLVVRDMKTGLRENTPFQLGLYAYAANVTCGINIVLGDFYYAKDDTVSKYYDLRNFTPEYLGQQFLILEETINQNLWMARPSADCYNCPVYHKCREFN